MPASKLTETSVENIDLNINNHINEGHGITGVVHQFPNKQMKIASGGGNGDGGGVHYCVMQTRVAELESNEGKILKEIGEVKFEVQTIKNTLGEIPDPIAGTPGRGISSLLFRIANKVLKDQQYSSPDIQVSKTIYEDVEEGEITKVQDRAELLIRAKIAESEAKAAKEAMANKKEAEVEANKMNLEFGKLKIERWKLILGVLGAIIGPGAVSAFISNLPSIIKFFQ